MSAESVLIPDDLLNLKTSDALESVPMSTLARRGTAVLQQLVNTAQPVAVKVQGQGAMVTLSQRQYDEMIALIQQLKQEQQDDGFTQALSQRFDAQMAAMNQAGVTENVEGALFSDPERLNQSYAPGDTESKD